MSFLVVGLMFHRSLMYSFEELILPCYSELLAYASKRTRSKAGAEDVVQESFARALRAWPRWQPQGEPAQHARAWMFRIVSNTFATKHYRREKNDIKTITMNSHMVAAEIHHGDHCEHEYLKNNTLGDEIREALTRIRPDWAEIVRMVYLEDMSAREVAKQLNLAPGTVRSRMARGRLALARILSPYARQRWGFGVKGDSSLGDDAISNVCDSCCVNDNHDYTSCKQLDTNHNDNLVCMQT